MHTQDHSSTDTGRRPTNRRITVGKTIAAVGILYSVLAASYGAWLLWQFVTAARPWNLPFGVAVLAVAGILGWVSSIRLRADPADPKRYAASTHRAAKGDIALSIVIALMGTMNLVFFITGSGLWSLVIGIAALAISVLLGTAAGRQLRGRHSGPRQTP